MALIITPLIFGIELISSLIRPLTLGIRLFANMFADEQVALNISNLFPPFTQFLVPIALLPLGGFRCARANSRLYFAFDDLSRRSFARTRGRTSRRRTSRGNGGGNGLDFKLQMPKLQIWTISQMSNLEFKRRLKTNFENLHFIADMPARNRSLDSTE